MYMCPRRCSCTLAHSGVHLHVPTAVFMYTCSQQCSFTHAVFVYTYKAVFVYTCPLQCSFTRAYGSVFMYTCPQRCSCTCSHGRVHVYVLTALLFTRVHSSVVYTCSQWPCHSTQGKRKHVTCPLMPEETKCRHTHTHTHTHTMFFLLKRKEI